MFQSFTNWHQNWHTSVMILRLNRYRTRLLTTNMPFIGFSILCLLISTIAISSDLEKKGDGKLFESSKPLDLIIQLDMRKVLEDKSEDPQYDPALLVQKIDDQTIQIYNIKIKARGNTRRVGNICEFPPLKINLKKKETKNTLFEGQDKIKMVTHCNNSDDYQNYALMEYLAYKTYNSLTEYSYNVRLVNVLYKDTKQNYPDIQKSGFLIEDDDLLAQRIGGTVTDKRIWSPDSCEEKSFDIFSLFQFMIGNTDWWVHTRHNVDLISLENKELIPIPFDFDGAGIINTPYAIPSKQLPIVKVRDRFFKGSCRNIINYQETVDLFNSKQDVIISLIENADFLDRKIKRQSINYVEDFYKIINNEGRFTKYMSQTCDYFQTSIESSHLNY